MSFYVTLPSNASLDLFPNNTLSDYTTQLKLPLKFDVPYEVGIAEITYSNLWSYNLGRFRFKGSEFDEFANLKDEPNNKLKLKKFFSHAIFPIDLKVGDTIRTLINKINDTLHGIIFYEEKMSFNNDEVFKKFLDNQRDNNLLPELLIVDNHQIQCRLPNNTYFILEKSFIDLFGLPHSILADEEVSIHFDTIDKELSLVNSLYVYSDIIKYQYVGDTLSPLLRNVQVTNNHLTASTITYDMPHYIPLINSSINAINISIKDESGSNILFMRGSQKTIVKLHFRPMRYGF